MSGYEIKKVKTGRFHTFFCEAGENHEEAIILLHGSAPGASSQTNWRNILPSLKERYHVIAPDMFGFGQTDHPQELPKSFWEWTRLRVEQVIELMDHLGIQKTHLVGNSMGGIVSLNLVMNEPNRFEKVVLMGSGGGHSTPTPEIGRMVGFYRDPSYTNLKNLFKWFVFDEKVLGDELEKITQERYEETQLPEVRRSYISNMFPMMPGEGVIPPAALRRMEQSFLLLHGTNDRFVPKESSLSLLEHLPNAQLHLFNQCGHWIQIEQTEKFLTLVNDFLESKI
jgi:2-hydroxymuconate-semialdehyde hydrolase